ncbi:MAG: hypothetical protein JWQ09_2246 [Segetibacter sp.]|nr:hypothetical protein [Segetibacter sp.]
MKQIAVMVVNRVESKLNNFLLFILISAIPFSVCKAQSSGTFPLQIVFKNVVDSVPMQLLNSYQNPFGEDYTIHMFKYYISDIAFQKAGGKTIKLPGSHLINEADSGTKTITLNLAPGEYKAISFLIGVDSIYNVSGTQTDDLDPLNGMFWTWNSGYIMAKLEATSTVSTAPNNRVDYHIGGFRTGQKTARIITIPLPKSSGKMMDEIVIEANANTWFNAVHSLKIADNPVCTTPGKLAVLYADNYAKMFTLASVK